ARRQAIAFVYFAAHNARQRPARRLVREPDRHIDPQLAPAQFYARHRRRENSSHARCAALADGSDARARDAAPPRSRRSRMRGDITVFPLNDSFLCARKRRRACIAPAKPGTVSSIAADAWAPATRPFLFYRNLLNHTEHR